MSVLAVIGVGLIGGCGALGRLLADASISARRSSAFPLGTFAVNMAGSLALGLLAGITADRDVVRLLATGLLGSFTTFSTWMFETERLAEDGEVRIAVANVVLSLIAGVGLAWLGREIGAAL